MKRRSQPVVGRYDAQAAETFWSQRVSSTGKIAAVLTYNARPEINRAYDAWEKRVLSTLLGGRPRVKRAVDVGAGVGRISLLLASKGIDVVALDNSRTMLDRIAAASRNKRWGRKITTVHSVCWEIPLADKSCDLVVCFGLLEHLPEKERRLTLEESARVLAAGGRMLVVVNNAENPLLKNKVVGANPAYAHVHYLMEPGFKNPPLKSRELKKILDAALTNDLRESPASDQAREFASHFLVELKKR